MNNRDFYKETFSQVHSRRELNWEEFEHMESNEKKRRSLRPLASLAAVAAICCALSSGAIAANLLGLRDLLLRPSVGATDWGQPMSLSGYMDTPESQALAEWLEFQERYDPDHAILQSVGNTLDSSLANYSAYLVYTPEMAEKLEEIAAKYDLKLHRTVYDANQHPELTAPLGNFMGQTKGDVNYMYEDGTFHVDGWAYLTDDNFGPVEFQLQRSVKGTLHDALVYLQEVEAFTQWDYTTKKGLPVKLALGPDRSMLLVDFKDCFVTVLVLDGERQNAGVGSQQGLTPAHLQELADQLDLGLLSPVATPAPDSDPECTPYPPAGERTDAIQTYAAVLRNLLYSGVLPDGRLAESEVEGLDSFAVLDVDGDGREELILFHTADITAGQTGYVIDFDESYTGDAAPIYLQAETYPLLTFYAGGYMAVGASHNQGWAGEVLWPYELYRHTEGDRYTAFASVDAWDSAAWPDAYGQDSEAYQVAQRSGGPVYFITYTYAADLSDNERSLILDQAGYNAWLEELNMGEKFPLAELPLTEKNIAALEAAPITADSLASNHLPTDVSEGVTVLGTYDFPITVSPQTTFTLRANCRAVASGYDTWTYGVQSLDVMEGNTIYQTLNISDAELASAEAEGDTHFPFGDGWTQGDESDYLPQIADLNFDSAQDIRLLDYRGVVNGRYLHWLWNRETEQFEYAFTLVGYDFEIDPAARQLRTTARDDAAHTTETYAYDKSGKLCLIDTQTAFPN